MRQIDGMPTLMQRWATSPRAMHSAGDWVSSCRRLDRGPTGRRKTSTIRSRVTAEYPVGYLDVRVGLYAIIHSTRTIFFSCLDLGYILALRTSNATSLHCYILSIGYFLSLIKNNITQMKTINNFDLKSKVVHKKEHNRWWSDDASLTVSLLWPAV